MNRQALRTWIRVTWLALLVSGVLVHTGCGGNGFATDSLVQPSGRSQSALDGFVFVPSRSRADLEGNPRIPHAIIKVYQLPRHDGDQPIAVGQADLDGRYRISGLPAGVPLLVVATDPFSLPGETPLTLSGLTSFKDETEKKTRDLSDFSTVAAAVVEKRGVNGVLSDAQVAQLESIANNVLANPPLNAGNPNDVTSNSAALDRFAQVVDEDSFGSILVRVGSDPTTTARVSVNGALAGTVTTVASASLSDSSPGLLLENQVVGAAELKLAAVGFLDDVVVVDVVANETVDVTRTLVPAPLAGQNRPPTIVSARTLPKPVGFEGGEVTIQAVVRDPESDPVTASATVTLKTTIATRQTTFSQTVRLTKSATNTYTGTVTVPGNVGQVALAYQVVVSATDGQADRTPVQAVTQFTVNGVEPPPSPPSTGPSATEIAALNQKLGGTWVSRLVAEFGSLNEYNGTPTQLTFTPASSPTASRHGTWQSVDGPVTFQGTYAIVRVTTEHATVLVTELAADNSTVVRITPILVAYSDGNQTLWTMPGDGTDRLSLFRKQGTSVTTSTAKFAFLARTYGNWGLARSGLPGAETAVTTTGEQITIVPVTARQTSDPVDAYYYGFLAGHAVAGTIAGWSVGTDEAIASFSFEAPVGRAVQGTFSPLSPGFASDVFLQNLDAELRLVVMTPTGLLTSYVFERSATGGTTNTASGGAL